MSLREAEALINLARLDRWLVRPAWVRSAEIALWVKAA